MSIFSTIGSIFRKVISIFVPTAAPATVSVADVEKAIEMAAQANWSAMITAIKNGNWVADVVAADEILKIIGVFFPPAAVIATDIDVVMSAVQILVTLAEGIHPAKTQIALRLMVEERR